MYVFVLLTCGYKYNVFTYIYTYADLNQVYGVMYMVWDSAVQLKSTQYEDIS